VEGADTSRVILTAPAEWAGVGVDFGPDVERSDSNEARALDLSREAIEVVLAIDAATAGGSGACRASPSRERRSAMNAITQQTH
jgi:hypothetical protein